MTKRALLGAGLFIVIGLAAVPGQSSRAGEAAAGQGPAASGMVVAVRGEVTAETGGQQRKLAIKSPVNQGDLIVTGKTGRVQVMFTDKTLMNLGPETKMSVEKYLFGADGAKPQIETKLQEGVLRVMGGKIAKVAPENFKVETPTATIGIRGSMFGASFRARVLAVVHLGGKGVDVVNPAGRTALLRPQQGTLVRGEGQAPQAARHMDRDFMNALLGDTAVAGGEHHEEAEGDSGAGGEPAAGEEPAADGGDAPAAGEEPVAADGTSDGGDTTATADGTSGEATSFDSAADGDALAPAGDDILATDSTATAGDTGDLLWSDPATVTQDVTTLTTDTQQTQTTDATAAVAPDPQYSFSGYFALGMRGPQTGMSSDDARYDGLADGISQSGVINGKGIDSRFPFMFNTVAPSTGGFTNYGEAETYLTWDLAGAPRSMPVWYFWDNLGEFVTYWTASIVDGYFIDGGSLYDVDSLGYLGLRCPNVPTDGLCQYGLLSGGSWNAMHVMDSETNSLNSWSGPMTTWINYRNRKVLGMLWHAEAGAGDYEPLMVVTGRVSGNQIVDLKYFGMYERFSGTSEYLLKGQGAQSYIFGSKAQAIGLFGYGDAAKMEGSQPIIGNWKGTASAFLEPSRTRSSAPSGVIPMLGFSTGLSMDLLGAGTNQETFSDNYNNLVLTVDLDAGTLTGTLNSNYGQFQVADLSLGGARTSVAVAPDLFFAEAGGGTIWNGNHTASQLTKPGGNFIATDFHEPGPSPWACWGEWGVVFNDPNNPSVSRMLDMGMWVAGKKTPEADINALITNNFSATYTGPARVLRFTNTSAADERGSVSLNVLFGPKTFSGSVSTDSYNLSLSGSVSSGGFTGTVPLVIDSTDSFNSAPSASQVRGMFCGPGADTAIGMVRASRGDGVNYHATFIGRK